MDNRTINSQLPATAFPSQQTASVGRRTQVFSEIGKIAAATSKESSPLSHLQKGRGGEVVGRAHLPPNNETNDEKSGSATMWKIATSLKKETFKTENSPIKSKNFNRKSATGNRAKPKFAPKGKETEVDNNSSLLANKMASDFRASQLLSSSAKTAISPQAQHSLIAQSSEGKEIDRSSYEESARQIFSNAKSSNEEKKLAAQYYEKAAESLQKPLDQSRAKRRELAEEMTKLENRLKMKVGEKKGIESRIKTFDLEIDTTQREIREILSESGASPVKKDALMRRITTSKRKSSEKQDLEIDEKLELPKKRLESARQSREKSGASLGKISEEIDKLEAEIKNKRGEIDAFESYLVENQHDFLAATAATFDARIEGALQQKIDSNHPINETLGRGNCRYVSGLDSGVVKLGCARVEEKNIEGVKKSCIDFKLSRYARTNLDNNLKVIQENRQLFNKKLNGNSLLGEVSIKKGEYCFQKKGDDGIYSNEGGYKPTLSRKPVATLEITFKGVGRVTIVDEPKMGCLYQDLSIQIDEGVENPAQAAQQIAFLLGLGPSFAPQTDEDIGRLKIATIFHQKFPHLANSIEHKQEFYERSVSSLRNEMIALEKKDAIDKGQPPRAEAEFNKYLRDQPSLIKEVEIEPGMKILTLSDLNDQMRENGAVGLMMSVTGWGEGSKMEKLGRALGGILEKGGLSSEQRLRNGLIVAGSSTAADLESGGGAGVFMRAVPKNSLKYDIESSYVISGDGRMIIDLAAVNEDCYGYSEDLYGRKNFSDVGGYESYAERRSMPELMQEIEANIGRDAKTIKEQAKMVAGYKERAAATEKKLEEVITSYPGNLQEKSFDP